MEAVVQKQTPNGYECIPASLDYLLPSVGDVYQSYFCFDAENPKGGAQSSATAVFPVSRGAKNGHHRDWSFAIWLGFDSEETNWLLDRPKRIGALKKWIFQNAVDWANNLDQSLCPLPKEELEQILQVSRDSDIRFDGESSVSIAIWSIALEAAAKAQGSNIALCLPAAEKMDDLFFDLLTQLPRPLRKTSIASPCMPKQIHATFNFFKEDIRFDQFEPNAKTAYILDGVKRASFYHRTAEFLTECQHSEELNARWLDPQISNFAAQDIARAVLQYTELAKADPRCQQEACKKNPALAFLQPTRQEAVPENMQQNEVPRNDSHFRKTKKGIRIFKPGYLWPLTQVALCLWLVMKILENTTSYLEEDHTLVLNMTFGSTPVQILVMGLLVGLIMGGNLGSFFASRCRTRSRFYPKGRKVILYIPDKSQLPTQN